MNLMDMSSTRNSSRIACESSQSSGLAFSLWERKGQGRLQRCRKNHPENLVTKTSGLSRKNGESGSGWTWVQMAASAFSFQHGELDKASDSTFGSSLCLGDKNNNIDLVEVV